MSEMQIKKIEVDDETVLEILRYGSGKPSVLLTSGVHGNEKTGPVLLYKLCDQLTSVEIRGGVTLLCVSILNQPIEHFWRQAQYDVD